MANLFSGLVTVTAKATVESTNSKFHANKNGVMPIWLEVINGKAPNRNIIDGSVAEREGIKAGKAYLMKIQETEANEYGRQFTWKVVKELEFVEILQATALGKPEVFKVEEEVQKLEDIIAEQAKMTSK